MAKTNKKSSKRGKAKKTVVVRQRRANASPVLLDARARAYARLLMDPCSAPAASGVYGGNDSGFIVKCESYVTFADGATPAGIFLWTPGALSINGKALRVQETATPGTPLSFFDVSNLVPGAAFLQANASNYRVLAACMTVMYTGTELNRSGTIAFGQCTGSVLNTTNSVDSLYPLLQHSCRTPDNSVDVVWCPGMNDGIWKDPNTDNSAPHDLERRAAIGIACKNLQANTGLEIKMTAVYEYLPSINFGITTPVQEVVSDNTLSEVINYIRRTGYNFITTHGDAVARAAGAAMVQNLVRNRGGPMRVEL